jgi:hypothetical protein
MLTCVDPAVLVERMLLYPKPDGLPQTVQDEGGRLEEDVTTENEDLNLSTVKTQGTIDEGRYGLLPFLDKGVEGRLV